jgi:hypothetical protein
VSLLLLVAIGCAAPPAPVAAPSPAFDHEHTRLASVYAGAVGPSGVDYGVVATRREALDAWLAAAAEAPVASFTPEQRVALWVNAYNALTIRLVLDHPQIASIRDLDGGEVWKRRTFRVAGETLTLDALEHQRIRPASDGRVHAVLSCAARSCPPLPAEPLRAGTIDAQLTAAASAWARGGALTIRGDTVYLSEIFKWFPEDFAQWRQGPIVGANEAQTRGLWFVARYADDDRAERAVAGVYAVAWDPYDWSLNRAPTAP